MSMVQLLSPNVFGLSIVMSDIMVVDLGGSRYKLFRYYVLWTRSYTWFCSPDPGGKAKLQSVSLTGGPW